MNILELTERNVAEARNLFMLAKGGFYEAIGQDVADVDIEKVLKLDDDTVTTYLLVDKGVYQSLVTVNKPTSTIDNFWVNFDIVDEQYLSKFMEFVIKQFSAITLVFLWVDSTDDKLAALVEDYGFEYTGEQNYIDGEKNILNFRYVYKRRK